MRTLQRLVLVLVVAFVAADVRALPEEFMRARAENNSERVVALGEEYLANNQGSDADRLEVVKSIYYAHGKLGEHDRGLDAAEKHLVGFNPADLDSRGRELYFGILQAMAGRLNSWHRTQEAEALYRRVLDDEYAEGTTSRRSASLGMASVMAKQNEDVAVRLALLADVLPHNKSLSYGGSLEMRAMDQISRLLAETGTDQGARDSLAELASEIRRVMALGIAGEDARLNESELCERAQTLTVDIHLQLGEFNDALFESKILLETAVSEEGMEVAIDRLVKCLRVKEGNFARINAVLEYQKHGRRGRDGELGTEDDLDDPLADIALDDSEKRDKEFSELMGQFGNDWRGYLAKGKLCRFWGRNEQAVREMWHAYSLCPMEEEAMQNVSGHLVAALVQASGDSGIRQQFIDFQQLGPAGPDGQIGTDDDLADPVARYLQE